MSDHAICSGPTQAHAFRLMPKDDLVPAIVQAAKHAMRSSSHNSAFIMTAVGSLSKVTLRMAAVKEITNKEGSDNDNPLGTKERKACGSAPRTVTPSSALEVKTITVPVEIVSLVGTFTLDGNKHLHMSVANASGDVIGGHLMGGCVYTTCEVVLGTIGHGVLFTREMDEATGYHELVVTHQSAPTTVNKVHEEKSAARWEGR